MNNLDYRNSRKRYIKSYFQILGAAMITIAIPLSLPSNLGIFSLFEISFLTLCVISVLIAFLGFINLNFDTLAGLLIFLCWSLMGLSLFIIGLLSQDHKAIIQGSALGLPPYIGWPILILSLSLAIKILHKIQKQNDFEQYYQKVKSAQNFNTDNRLYFVDHPHKEPELYWGFFNKKNTNEITKADWLIPIAIILFPLGTGIAYITIMSQYHPFALNRILFYMSFFTFLFTGYISLSIYYKYLAYRRLQKELGITFKPAILTSVNK